MTVAKIFQNGQSQAVRLPKEFRFNCNEVGIKKIGAVIVLYHPKEESELFYSSLGGFSDDVFQSITDARNEEILSERVEL